LFGIFASFVASIAGRIPLIGLHLAEDGRLVAAIKTIGRGADTDGNVPFVLPLSN